MKDELLAVEEFISTLTVIILDKTINRSAMISRNLFEKINRIKREESSSN